jgi:hypothetical protein
VLAKFEYETKASKEGGEAYLNFSSKGSSSESDLSLGQIQFSHKIFKATLKHYQ